jgi:hypothetical protein
LRADFSPAVLMSLHSHHHTVTIDIDLLLQVWLRCPGSYLEAPG